MNVQVVDFETYWSSKDYTLSKMGPISYIRDNRFDAQMIGISTNGGRVRVDDRVELAVKSIDFDNDLLVAHNGGGFDFLIFSERLGIHPKNMVDTIWCMRWCGLSSISRESHAALTELLGNGVKRAGTVISDGKQWPSQFTPSEYLDFMQYCAEDVEQCAANFSAMLPYLTPECVQFQSITCRMATEPVFELDAEILEEYIKQLDAEAEDARQKLMELFHFSTLQEFFKAIRSGDRFAEMLRSLGIEPSTKRSEQQTATAAAKAEALGDVEGAAKIRAEGIYTWAFSKSDIEFLDLQEHEDPRVRLLVETRLQFNGSILRTRAETLLKFARMGKPLPIMLSAFKAHTGRYSAGASEGKTDSVQIQNLSKRNPAHLALRKAIKAPAGYKVVACDSSQVEARVNAWFCNEYGLVEQFRTGRDPYSELAEKFGYGYSAEEIHNGAKAGDKFLKALRNAGKTGILSAQYSVSAHRYSDTLWRSNIRLDDVYDKHCELATHAHSIYRQTHPAIVRMWNTLSRVIKAMAVGESGVFGGPDNRLMQFGMYPIIGRDDLLVPTIISPSGFHLRYPGLRYKADTDEFVYNSWLGKNTIAKRIFGGLLLNNIIQHLAFMIMLQQACWMDDDGIALKCNIHDAWATVVPEAEAKATGEKMLYWMRQVPTWAEGCPIDAEYEISDDFTGV